jgi:hypothetical protein
MPDAPGARLVAPSRWGRGCVHAERVSLRTHSSSRNRPSAVCPAGGPVTAESRRGDTLGSGRVANQCTVSAPETVFSEATTRISSITTATVQVPPATATTIATVEPTAVIAATTVTARAGAGREAIRHQGTSGGAASSLPVGGGTSAPMTAPFGNTSTAAAPPPGHAPIVSRAVWRHGPGAWPPQSTKASVTTVAPASLPACAHVP